MYCPYKILDVKKTDSLETIKKKYRILSFKDEFEHFFYGGNLEDVDISIPKMEAFLKLKKSELEKLSEEFIKKI